MKIIVFNFLMAITLIVLGVSRPGAHTLVRDLGRRDPARYLQRIGVTTETCAKDSKIHRLRKCNLDCWQEKTSPDCANKFKNLR